MPSYVRRGELPAQRHTQFRGPDGRLYAEELFSTKGFESVYSLLYHLRPPTAISEVQPWKRQIEVMHANDPVRNRHFLSAKNERRGDAIEARTVFLANADIAIATATFTGPMSYFYRNANGDELLFIHEGNGVLESPFGTLAYRAHDYLLIPCGTTYRLTPGQQTTMLVYESRGSIEIPKQYRNASGQLVEGAPYYERDFRMPDFVAPNDTAGPYEIRVANGGRDTTYTVPHHPFDVVGWDGYCYPYAFNLDDFAPLTGKLHQPPPVHATFEAPGAAFCAFVPRLFDYHPLAIPIPYNHSNVDCDEVIYYASGDFMSRRGVACGSITLHAAGSPHGPQPGAIEASLGKRQTNELAVMVDTFRPLEITEAAQAVEDATYYRSWLLEDTSYE